MEIKNRLKVVMAEKDMQVIELANKTGLHPNYISALRNDRKEPGIYNVLLIANTLNVSVEEIWSIKK